MISWLIFIVILFADVGPPLQTDYLRNFNLQGFKPIFHLFNLLRRRCALEFETDNVLKVIGGAGLHYHPHTESEAKN